MMAEAYSLLSLLLCLLTGGGNDLLDYLPTESYWHEKKVEVTVDQMIAQLADKPGQDVTALVKDLASPDAAKRDDAAMKLRAVGPSAIKSLQDASQSPDVELRRGARTVLRQIQADEIEHGVRRLMAIRTLGELGKPEAVPALRPLLQSKELFVAEYAQAAIDRIEGKPASASTSRAVAPRVADDVWMLPAECKTVGQLVPRRGTPIGIAEFLTAVKGAQPGSRESDAESVTRMVLSIADKMGNIRIDGATFGIVGPLVDTKGRPAAGHVTVIFRGKYHSEWVRTLAEVAHVPATDVDGVAAYQPDNESGWLIPSDELFVYTASPKEGGLPLKALAAAVKSGKGALAADAQQRALVQSVDTKQVLWAASVVTPEQRTLPVVGAFDTITLVGTRQGKTLTLTMKGRGSDAAEVKAAADAVNKHAKDSVEFLAGIHGQKTVDLSVQLLRSMHATADGTTATLTAKLETTPAAILALPEVQDEPPDQPQASPAHPRLKK
jgi:hypothetical protein